MSANAIDRLAVMFTALSGIDAIARRDGDAASVALLQDITERFRSLAVEYEGEVVDVVGNELLIVFRSSDAALNCACRLQTLVHTEEAIASNAIALAVGIHFGVVYRKGPRVFGDSVNTAARVKSQAPTERILISEDLKLTLHQESLAIVSPYDRVEVKGKARPLTLLEVMWAPEDLNRTSVMAEMIDTGYLKNLAAHALHLHFGEVAHTITNNMTPITLGRGAQCDIPMDCPTASRLHCRLEHRRGKFVLVDSSTNGTHLMRSDGSAAVLKREQAVLTGHGRFAMGQDPDEASPFTFSFECD